ncbi:MAG: sterol desaturase family protein, partial [Proteobacteria bacterium]|nr:sterol desaturase family protein [Pseudomonadota bacterium]
LFEIILNTTSMFNHGNVYIGATLDRCLRWFIVTPDMHRVHHSVIKDETDSNYGFNVPWWDRLFRTYRAQPQSGHLRMKIGQDEFQGAKAVHIGWLLVQPFLNARRVSNN